MTAGVVAPLVFPGRSATARLRAAGPGSRRVPVPRLSAVRERSSMYALAVVEQAGRIAVPKGMLRAMGWDTATTMTVRERSGLITVIADAGGGVRVNRQGRLQVPVTIRRWCGLAAGGSVLLVADVDVQRLVVHPAAALDELITRRHADAFGDGEQA